MKKMLFWGFLLISLIIIVNLTQGIYTLWHKQDVLTSAQRQLEREKKENTKLHQELTQVNSQSFLEEEARNKLLLVKPGEGKVIISQDQVEKTPSQKTQDTRVYWQQWIDVFFH